MQPNIKTYNVHIAGQPLRLKATHDQETVNEIILMVETQLNKTKNSSSKQQAATLACLHLAEELFFLRQKAKKELETIESLAVDHLSQMQIS